MAQCLFSTGVEPVLMSHLFCFVRKVSRHTDIFVSVMSSLTLWHGFRKGKGGFVKLNP